VDDLKGETLNSVPYARPVLLRWNLDHFFIFAMIDLEISESRSKRSAGEDTASVCFSGITNDAADEDAFALESSASTGAALQSTANGSSCDESMLDTESQTLKSKSPMLLNQENAVVDRNTTSSTTHPHLWRWGRQGTDWPAFTPLTAQHTPCTKQDHSQ
jgi:hypothetical protein